MYFSFLNQKTNGDVELEINDEVVSNLEEPQQDIPDPSCDIENKSELLDSATTEKNDSNEVEADGCDIEAANGTSNNEEKPEAPTEPEDIAKDDIVKESNQEEAMEVDVPVHDTNIEETKDNEEKNENNETELEEIDTNSTDEKSSDKTNTDDVKTDESTMLDVNEDVPAENGKPEHTPTETGADPESIEAGDTMENKDLNLNKENDETMEGDKKIIQKEKNVEQETVVPDKDNNLTIESENVDELPAKPDNQPPTNDPESISVEEIHTQATET